MFRKFFTILAIAGFLSGVGFSHAEAADLKIPLPRRSELTPVQRLNREGVQAIRKHDYAKAEALFYKAYLYDASDPFTLNNLGYVSELEGKLDRAKRFYSLAREQDCDAVIDMSSARGLKGKPMTAALTGLQDVPMEINRMNVQAVDLLAQDRNLEAYLLLRKALKLDPHNAFTLNNLGVAEEANGDYSSALKYYDAAAAATDSSEPVVVTLDRSWRGKPVSEMAMASAKRLRRKMGNLGPAQMQATMLATRGVAAINQNNWAAARQDFLAAYSADPESAFSLNNMGYVAERSGDIETAQFYYSKAQKAENAKARVGLATRLAAQGEPLENVALASNQQVNHELDLSRQAARRQTGPIELVPRGASPTPQPVAPPAKALPVPQSNSQPQPPTSN